MISFRVTDEEFERLRTRSEAVGARSISDFARDSLCSSRPPDIAEPSVTHLSGMLHELSTQVRRMKDVLTAAGDQPASEPDHAATDDTPRPPSIPPRS